MIRSISFRDCGLPKIKSQFLYNIIIQKTINDFKYKSLFETQRIKKYGYSPESYLGRNQSAFVCDAIYQLNILSKFEVKIKQRNINNFISCLCYFID